MKVPNSVSPLKEPKKSLKAGPLPASTINTSSKVTPSQTSVGASPAVQKQEENEVIEEIEDEVIVRKSTH